MMKNHEFIIGIKKNVVVIPDNFDQHGTTYTVLYNKTMVLEDGFVGTAHERLKTIHIQMPIEGYEMNREYILTTYYHELIHVILNEAGYNELSKDEQLVDQLGRGLLEYELTKRGNLEKEKK